MVVKQQMKMAAKSGATVTLGKLNQTGVGVTQGGGEGHPDYLQNNAMVITTNLATADATFWGCPGIYEVIIRRLT